MSKGYLAFVLHGHLPYVRHPEYGVFLEERWFFEALTESYIPLLRVFERLVADGVRFRVSFSVSPTLLSMLEDTQLAERYDAHLAGLIELATRELERTRHDERMNRLAHMYLRSFQDAREVWSAHDGRLSGAFAALHARGALELMTTTATHGILPFLAAQPRAAEAQVSVGLECFERVFGFRPDCLWLPECAYAPGIERLLARAGVRAFCMESHGVENANPAPAYGVYAPIYTPSGVAAFARDRNSTKEVWSAREGFPGHPDYREFYRDIGQELELSYIEPYIAGGVRADTGIKYHRITGRSHKDVYDADRARERAAQHAQEFLDKRRSDVEHLAGAMERRPIVVAPFDAELFGHWWFEGPQWLDFVIRKAFFDQQVVELTSLSDYLDRHPVHQLASPASSSWGHRGHLETWLNGKTDWAYPLLTDAATRMTRLAEQHAHVRLAPVVRRALNQAARELLLAQSSDWPFIISNGTAEQYATRRLKDHFCRFDWLACAIERGEIDDERLRAIETVDALFPDIAFEVYCEEHEHGG